MTSVDTVRRYLEILFTHGARPEDLRECLAERSFEVIDPMMTATSVDAYIGQLESLAPTLKLSGRIRGVLGAGAEVATLVEFDGPEGPMTYAQWFTVGDEGIERIEVVYDPRPFLRPEQA